MVVSIGLLELGKRGPCFLGFWLTIFIGFDTLTAWFIISSWDATFAVTFSWVYKFPWHHSLLWQQQLLLADLMKVDNGALPFSQTFFGPLLMIKQPWVFDYILLSPAFLYHSSFVLSLSQSKPNFLKSVNIWPASIVSNCFWCYNRWTPGWFHQCQYCIVIWFTWSFIIIWA